MTMISLPPKLYHTSIILSNSYPYSYCLYWELWYMLQLHYLLRFDFIGWFVGDCFPSQSHCYFRKAQHKMQTDLNTVLTVHSIQPVVVKPLRYMCLCNVSSGSLRTLTDGTLTHMAVSKTSALPRGEKNEVRGEWTEMQLVSFRR